MGKRFAGVALFIIVFVLYRYTPVGKGFGEEYIKAIALVILCMLLWFTEFIPLGASAILILIIPALLGLCSVRDMLKAFPNPILFFVIATFSLSAAITKVAIAQRILLILLRSLGWNVNMFILAVMGATFLISSIMSNIPATAIFIPIVTNFLELYDSEADKRRTGRCMMIGLAIAGMVGGIITPAGSANNLLAISFLEQYCKITIPFLYWIIICAPIAIIILPITWLLITIIFRPVPVPPAKIAGYIDKLKLLPKPDKKEIKVGITFLGMIFFWILSTWIPAFDITIISIIGMTVMFLPGIDIFSWKEFSKEVSWAAVLMIGSVLCVGNIIITTNMAELFSNTFFQVRDSVPIFVLILRLALFVAILQLLVPNGPAVIAVAALPVINFANSVGVNPVIFIVILTVLSSWTIIIPLSAVPMITYSTGYYKIIDIGKVGVPVLIVVTLIMAVWVPWMVDMIM